MSTIFYYYLNLNLIYSLRPNKVYHSFINYKENGTIFGTEGACNLKLTETEVVEIY